MGLGTKTQFLDDRQGKGGGVLIAVSRKLLKVSKGYLTGIGGGIKIKAQAIIFEKAENVATMGRFTLNMSEIYKN